MIFQAEQVMHAKMFLILLLADKHCIAPFKCVYVMGAGKAILKSLEEY